MRTLIADSGATKTDWALLDGGSVRFLKTSGLHPAYLEVEPLQAELADRLAETAPDRILFYGAGCYSEETVRPVRVLLSELFGEVEMLFYDDLTAVAHAFLGMEEGVAGILGTGSNSGYFLRGEKVKQVAALGYVLGDEGSAADIGKRVLRSLLREEFTSGCSQWLEARLGRMEYRKVVRELYSAQRPSYYLARVAGKVLKGDLPDEIGSLVDRSIEDFVDAHLGRYNGFPGVRVVLSGGIAVSQKGRIEAILHRRGVNEFLVSGGVITALADRESARQPGVTAGGERPGSSC